MPEITERPPTPVVGASELRDAVEWDLSSKQPDYAVIRAASFQRWVDTVCPVGLELAPATGNELKSEDACIAVGSWKFARRLVEPYYWWTPGFLSWQKPSWQRSALSVLTGGRQSGYVVFDGPVVIPGIFDEKGEPWMSATPSEAWSQRPGLRKAKGDVLIGGLGLGVFARLVRAKAGVGRVVVVDSNPHVIDVFGKIDGVDVVAGDFYEYAVRHGSEFNAILTDIWKDYGDAANDGKFRDLKAMYHGKTWGWGDFACLHSGYWSREGLGV